MGHAMTRVSVGELASALVAMHRRDRLDAAVRKTLYPTGQVYMDDLRKTGVPAKCIEILFRPYVVAIRAEFARMQDQTAPADGGVAQSVDKNGLEYYRTTVDAAGHVHHSYRPTP